MRRTIRFGLGKGRGRGYRNILPTYDKKVHKDSGQGKKQPQRLKHFVFMARGSYDLTPAERESLKKRQKLLPFKVGDYSVTSKINELGMGGYQVESKSGYVPEFAMGEPNWFTSKKDAVQYAKERMMGYDKAAYDFQDNNQEKVIHSGWTKGNSFRFVLEGTGDIFRELTKHHPHKSYIREKVNRLEDYLNAKETWIHPDDDHKVSYENNKPKFELMKVQWQNQPVVTREQREARDLNIAVLKDDIPQTRKLLAQLKQHLNIQ